MRFFRPRLSLLSGEVFIGVERTRTCAKVRPEQDASEHDRNKWLGARVAAGQATRGALSFGSFLWARKEKNAPVAAEMVNYFYKPPANAELNNKGSQGNYLSGKYRMGSTGVPSNRISKYSRLFPSASDPTVAIFWPDLTRSPSCAKSS